MVEATHQGTSYIFQAGLEETEQSLKINSLVDEYFSSSACGDVLPYSFFGGGGRKKWKVCDQAAKGPAGCSCYLDCTCNFHGIPPWWIFSFVAFLMVHLREALNYLITQ